MFGGELEDCCKALVGIGYNHLEGHRTGEYMVGSRWSIGLDFLGSNGVTTGMAMTATTMEFSYVYTHALAPS